MTDIDKELVGQHYLVAALWTDEEEVGEAGVDDLSDEAKAHVAAAVSEFVEKAGALIPAYFERRDQAGGHSAEAQMGHDLWLTRNGHGAGFWDRGLGELGDALSEIARGMGEVHLILGDDGKLYFE